MRQVLCDAKCVWQSKPINCCCLAVSLVQGRPAAVVQQCRGLQLAWHWRCLRRSMCVGSNNQRPHTCTYPVFYACSAVAHRRPDESIPTTLLTADFIELAAKLLEDAEGLIARHLGEIQVVEVRS